jgi:hypothetical protein
MKSSRIFYFNAIIFVAMGIAFSMYGPLVLAFMQVPEMEITPATYWQVAAFARMFGGALFTLGFLIWSLARLGDELPEAVRSYALRGLVLGNAVMAFVALTEQVSVWGVPAGWVLSGIFVVFSLLYIYLIFSKR